MSRLIAVVCEAAADFRTATELADREIVDAIEWLDEEGVAFQRDWVQHSPDGKPLLWKGIRKLAAEADVTASGHFDGEPGEADASMARRAILYLRKVFGKELQGIVLVRDQDDQPERREGLQQARESDDGKVQIVIGLAVVEREAWVISGFEPQDEAERERLDTERQRLGFYPHEQSHRLTACKDDTAQRSPKRVLKVLSEGGYERERQCWNTTTLAVLRERGTENGLIAYLDEVRAHLASLIGHVADGIDS